MERSSGDPMVACYIDSSFPALLHFAYKYADSPEQAILANANAGKFSKQILISLLLCRAMVSPVLVIINNYLLKMHFAGGENVARGSLLGALLGAAHGMDKFPAWSYELYDKDQIFPEIENFVASTDAQCQQGAKATAGSSL